MTLLKKSCERIILIIITISILIMFIATPASYAKLDLKDGEFYYAGTTKGTYTVKDGIFAWLLENIGQIADWLLGIITMGFRMVFVGWTALIEKLLTWGLESTVGINVAGEDVDGMSNTDLTSVTDSTNNLTVQAIVYNRVPAFNINFFDLSDEYDKTVSGTGKILVCEKCDKKVAECCTTTTCCKECGGNCDACKKYIAALINAEDPDGVDPIVIQLKKIVASWYYILRLLSMAIMLVVLIGIGIKMAVSTIASEKAVYKRMLVDWVVGTIILFSIHYIMLFIININDSLVKVIVEAANDVNTVQMKQLSEKQEGTGKDAGVKKDNEELEIDIYEAVRTRAYDPKLTNGLSGMLMYMTLVYFAIRYSIVYIKRYLTLLVLTLMGPPVGVAYALQKAFSGKSSTLKTWMTEYTMNVIIQSVHAIIYGVFISTALILSLQSISGIIVALILMNYSLKAESTFRKIFKFGDGDSLLGHTAEAGNAEKMKQNLDAAVGLYAGAKPLAGALMNTPYGKAVKGVGKVAAAAGIAGAAGIVGLKRSMSSSQSEFGKAVDKEMDKNYGGSEFKRNADGSDAETEENYEARRAKAEQAVREKNPKFAMAEEMSSDTPINTLMLKGEKNLRDEVEKTFNALNETKDGTPEHDNAKQKYNAALADYSKFKRLELPTNKDIVKGHAEQLVDIKNHFNFTKNAKGGYASFRNLNELGKGVFGTKHYDYKTGKMVSDGNGLYNQLSASNLLGFTDADKKIFKEQVLNPIKNGFGGMVMMFAGAGTLIAHPTMGIGLLAAGKTLKNKSFKKQDKNKRYKGKYGFSRFSTPSMIDVQKAALSRANREMNSALANQLKSTHPNLYNELRSEFANDNKSNFGRDVRNARNSSIAVGTLGAVAGGGIAFAPIAAVGAAGFMARKFTERSALGDNLSAINRHSIKQMREQQQEFIKEGMNYQSLTEMAKAERLKEGYDKDYEKTALEELGYEKDSVTGKFRKVKDTEFQKNIDQLEQKLIEEYQKEGKIYDPKTGTILEGRKTTSVSGIQQNDIEIKGKKRGKLTESDINDMNKELDAVIDKLVADNIDLDKINMENVNLENINNKSIKNLNEDEKNYKAVIEQLEKNFVEAGIISKKESVLDSIQDKKSSTIEAIKRRKEFNENKKKAISNSTLTNLDDTEKSSVEKALNKLIKEKSTIKESDVLAQIKSDFVAREEEAKSSLLTKKEKKDISERAEAYIKEIKSKNNGNIDEYIESVQISTMLTPKHSERDQQVESILETKKKKRADKLNQILNLEIKDVEVADDVIDALHNGKPLHDKSGDIIGLTKDDTTEIVEMLLIRKELESINEFTKEELELKKGSNSYKEALKQKSASAVDYYSTKLQIENFKQKNYELYDNDKLKSGTELEEAIKKIHAITGESENNIKAELNSITEEENKLKDKLARMEAAEKNIASKGPIVDITKFINNNY